MKILVTGGAGFIGSTLIPLLLKRKYIVTVVDNLMYGGSSLLPNFNDSHFSFVKGDVRDTLLMKNLLKDKDIIIHLAAIVGFPACRQNPDLAKAVNFTATKHIAKYLSKNQYIFFASTGSNYGALVDEICTEETPLNPLSIYGKTKTAAEQHLLEKTSCVAYRFATGFGLSPRLRLDLLINEFVYKAVKEKYLVVYESHFMRTFIHVQDIARSFLFAIDNLQKMRNQVYNVGSESMNFSKRKICDMISKETPVYIHYADVGEDADKRNYVVSYNKISNLGYKTTISIHAGIRELVKAMSVVQISHPYSNI